MELSAGQCDASRQVLHVMPRVLLGMSLVEPSPAVAAVENMKADRRKLRTHPFEQILDFLLQHLILR
jgi:hypothetical protein